MRTVIAALVATAVIFTGIVHAQNAGGFQKKNFNYREGTKGLFSEAVTVSHPGKKIFLDGVSDEGPSVAFTYQSSANSVYLPLPIRKLDRRSATPKVACISEIRWFAHDERLSLLTPERIAVSGCGSCNWNCKDRASSKTRNSAAGAIWRAPMTLAHAATR